MKSAYHSLIPYAMRPSGDASTVSLVNGVNLTDFTTLTNPKLAGLPDCNGRAATDPNYGDGCDPTYPTQAGPAKDPSKSFMPDPDCSGRHLNDPNYGQGCDTSDPSQPGPKPDVDCNGVAKSDAAYGTGCDTADPTKAIPVWKKPWVWAAAGGAVLVTGVVAYKMTHKKRR